MQMYHAMYETRVSARILRRSLALPKHPPYCSFLDPGVTFLKSNSLLPKKPILVRLCKSTTAKL